MGEILLDSVDIDRPTLAELAGGDPETVSERFGGVGVKLVIVEGATDKQLADALKSYDADVPMLKYLRTKRDILLRESDWTDLPNSTPKEGKPAWESYRQELKDLPQTTIDIANPVWPDAPK